MLSFRDPAARRAALSRRLAAVAMLLLGPPACNALTGADDLEVAERGAGQGGSGAATAGPTGAGAGQQGSGASGSATTGSGAGAGDPSGTGASTAGVGGAGPGCAPACAANQYCEASTTTCVCNPGFVMQGGGCAPAPVGDPTTHTEQEVCAQWISGHVITEPDPVVASGQECDAGSLKQGAIVDTLVRINMFRWLSGLGPTSNDASLDADAQLCANLESWWDFGMPQSPHAPPPDSKCYTAAGAASAGQSNIAWGSGHPAQAIDQFMEDNGNETTMGHRRWILNPPLDPVGIGYWETGGPYGNAECLRVFGGGGSGPNPPWSSMPSAGFVPLEIAQWTWTFHGSLGGIPTADVSVLRVDDNAALAIQMLPLQQGFAQDAISWRPSGWSAEAGKTYRVTIEGVSGGPVVYDVKPVACN